MIMARTAGVNGSLYYSVLSSSTGQEQPRPQLAALSIHLVPCRTCRLAARPISPATSPPTVLVLDRLITAASSCYHVIMSLPLGKGRRILQAV